VLFVQWVLPVVVNQLFHLGSNAISTQLFSRWLTKAR
jgi:hypothetical protein